VSVHLKKEGWALQVPTIHVSIMFTIAHLFPIVLILHFDINCLKALGNWVVALHRGVQDSAFGLVDGDTRTESKCSTQE
jgi:hypothetical protein